MTTIGFIATGFREARRQARVKKQQRLQDAKVRAQQLGITASTALVKRIGHVWMTLVGLALAATAAWTYTTWAGLLATAAACVIGEQLIGIGEK